MTEMIRSAEQLQVLDTERRVVGRARLVRYVVTTEVTVTVPVRREEVRLEYEADDDAAGDPESGWSTGLGELTSEVLELVLHAEEPVVTVVTVPVERVRVTRTVVTGEQVVEGQVREEQVAVSCDEPDAPPRHRRCDDG